MKRLLSFVLTAILLFSALPSELLSVRGEGNATAFASEENPFEGKVISILGDSISTFAGYISTADGFNLEHLARYTQDDLLTDVNETWWMQLL